jgi:hypothetical protein
MGQGNDELNPQGWACGPPADQKINHVLAGIHGFVKGEIYRTESIGSLAQSRKASS